MLSTIQKCINITAKQVSPIKVTEEEHLH